MFAKTLAIFPAVFGAMLDVSSAIKLPVAWIVAATSRASLLPTVIVITGCASALAFELPLPPRFAADEPPQEIVAAITTAQINSFKRAFHISYLSKYRILQYFKHRTLN